MNERELVWLREAFIRCRHLIQAALDHDIGTHDINDVWAELRAGTAQIWPAPHSVMITRIENYPRAKVLIGWISGAEPGFLHEIVRAEPFVAGWAAEHGCDLVMISGRRGWAKAFPGYSITHTVMTKRLTAMNNMTRGESE